MRDQILFSVLGPNMHGLGHYQPPTVPVLHYYDYQRKWLETEIRVGRRGYLYHERVVVRCSDSVSQVKGDVVKSARGYESVHRPVWACWGEFFYHGYMMYFLKYFINMIILILLCWSRCSYNLLFASCLIYRIH